MWAEPAEAGVPTLTPAASWPVPSSAAPGAPEHEHARWSDDALLQISRRLDWRFLLPEPEPGRVAYLGPLSGSLWLALRRLWPSVTMIQDPEHPAHANLERFDLVINSGPRARLLKNAVGLLKPGGWLYCEGYSWLTREGRHLGQGWVHSPRAVEHRLRRLGMGEVEAYWHWPNFEACTMILPLSQETVLRHVLLRRRDGALARLGSGLGGVLVQGGLMAHLAPYFSVVASRETDA